MLKLKKQFEKARVHLEIPCPECKGTGKVMNALWAQYWENANVKEDFKDWFWRKKQVPEDQIPDEIEVCAECDGKKVVDGMARLEDLFEEDKDEVISSYSEYQQWLFGGK